MLNRPKKAKFQSVYPQLEAPKPEPSSKAMPEWYRQMPGVKNTRMTIKKCVPFLDAMMSGYTISLAADVEFIEDGYVNLTKVQMVSNHHPEQTINVPVPPEYSPQPYKWENFFIMSTPKGYSTLFTSPLNRLDLPFISLSGVVDTDNHPVPVNFPFFIRKDFRGIIPAGTPIIQAIPFKRDDWKASVNDFDEPKLHPEVYKMHNPPFGFYKKKWWVRKSYK